MDGAGHGPRDTMTPEEFAERGKRHNLGGSGSLVVRPGNLGKTPEEFAAYRAGLEAEHGGGGDAGRAPWEPGDAAEADADRLSGGLGGTPLPPTPGSPAEARMRHQEMAGIVVLNRGTLDMTGSERAWLRARYARLRRMREREIAERLGD